MTIRETRQQKHELIVTRRYFRQLMAQKVIVHIYTTKQAAAICHCSTRTMRRAIELERTQDTNTP